MADDFHYEIVNECGILSEGKAGWKMELNLVQWGDRNPKYDIRSWSPDHAKMGKGITLTKEELTALKDILSKMNI
ncbi:MAG: YdbC family protein [Treponema sp.]|nr:YdbC family protein [Treponema sp.]